MALDLRRLFKKEKQEHRILRQIERGDRLGVRDVGDVEDLDPMLVTNIAVAELDLGRAGMMEHLLPHDRRDARVLGIVQVDRDEAGMVNAQDE